MPTRAASAATRGADDVLAVVEDAALGRAEQPVEVPDERRLAASVLADDRDPLAGRIVRSTPASARVPSG